MCRWEFRSRRAPLSERGRSMRSERETPNGRTWNCRVDILALSERCEEKKSSQNVSGMAEIPVIYVWVFFSEPVFGPVSKGEPWSCDCEPSEGKRYLWSTANCCWCCCCSCSVHEESGGQQQSSTAPFLCYRAQTHLPLAPPILPHHHH